MIGDVKGKKIHTDGGALAMLHMAVVLFGLAAVLGRAVDAPAVILSEGRVICSSVTLLIVSLIRKSDLKLKSKKDLAIALFTGAVLAIHWTTFFQAIQSSSVAIGTITFSAFPLFLTFLEPLVFHERLRFSSLMSAILLLLGVGITVPSFSLDDQVTIGAVWGLVSALAYAVMSLSNRYLSKTYEARTICLYEQGTAAILLLPALFLVRIHWTFQNIAGIAAIGLFCTAIAHSLYVTAQKKVKAQTAGIISGMETVYGILFAGLFLGETPGIREVIGGAVILSVAVVSSVVRLKRKDRSNFYRAVE